MSKLVQPATVPADERCDHPGSEKTLGEVAWLAYAKAYGGMYKDWPWAEVGTQEIWEAAAQAVRLAVIEECAGVIETSPFISAAARMAISAALRSCK